MSAKAPPKKRRKSWSRRLARAGLWLLVTVGGLVLLLTAALDLELTKRFVAEQVNLALANTFNGRLSLERVGHLSWSGLSGASVRIHDPSGSQRLYADGVRGSWQLWPLLRSLGQSGVPIDIRIDTLHIDYLDIDLAAGKEAPLAFIEAFDTPAPSTPDNDSDGAGVSLQISAVSVKHAWAHGAPASLGHFDVDVDQLTGAFDLRDGQPHIHIDGVELVSRSLPYRVSLAGRLSADFSFDANGNKIRGRYQGQALDSPLTAELAMDHGTIEASVELGPASPEALRELLPGWPLTTPLKLQAKATGSSEQLTFSGEARLPKTHLDAAGTLTLAPSLQLKSTLNATHIDLRELAATLPPSDIAVAVEVAAGFDAAGNPNGKLTMTSQPASLAGWQLPASTLVAHADRDGYRADFNVAQPLALKAAMQMKRGTRNLALDVTASAKDLAALAQTKLPIATLSGSATASAHGVVNLSANPQLTLSTQLDASRVGYPEAAGFGAQHIRATLKAKGPLRDPTLEVHAAAQQVAVAGQHVSRAHAQLTGDRHAARLSASAQTKRNGRWNVSAKLALSAALDGTGSSSEMAFTIQSPKLRWSKGNRDALFHATALHFEPTRIRLRGGRLTGLGAPITLNGSLSGTQVKASIRGEHIDLARVAELLQLKGSWSGKAKLAAEVDGRRVRLTVRAKEKTLGNLKLATTDVQLRGPATSPAAWRNAAGEISADGKLSLQALARRLARYDIVLPVTGALAFKAKLARQRGEPLPTLSLDGQLHDGTLLGYRAISIKLDGGFRNRALGGHASIRRGDQLIARLGLLAQLPKPSYTPEQLIQRSSWQPAKLSASLWLGPVELAQLLPPEQQMNETSGNLEMLVNLFGTVGAPQLALNGHLHNLRRPELQLPLHAVLHGRYDGKVARSTLTLNGAGRPVAVVNASAPLNNQQLQAQQFDKLSLDVHGAVHQLPANWLTSLAQQRMSGDINAMFSLAGYRRDAALDLTLNIERLAIAGAAQGRADVSAHLDGKALRADTKIANGGGLLTLEARGPMQWGSAAAPSIDAKLLELSLLAKRFELAALKPFALDTVKVLAGQLSGRLTLKRKQGIPHLLGNLLWNKGQLHLKRFGERIDNIIARVSADGKGGVRLHRFEGKSLGGKLDASGDAKLAGLSLSQLRARVNIPADAPLPLVLRGVTQGHVSGRIELQGKRARPDLPLNFIVDIPELHAELPKRARNDVQSLDAPEHIRIGTRDAAGKQQIMYPLTAPAAKRTKADRKPRAKIDEAPVLVRLRLGDDVELRQGDLLRVEVTGDVGFKVGKSITAKGALRLTSGTLDIKSKAFTIQQGTITFAQDATNPQIAVTAAWTAANGTVVYADYVGPVKSGKLTLRSQPTLTRGEILALLLFGTSDRNLSAVPGSSAAVSLASDVATQPLNKALRDVTGLDISTRVDTTRSESPAPEIELRIARSVSLQFTHILGLPTPSENPDRNLTTFVVRFLGNWSVELTVGDQGSSLGDVFWRFSY